MEDPSNSTDGFLCIIYFIVKKIMWFLIVLTMLYLKKKIQVLIFLFSSLSVLIVPVLYVLRNPVKI